MSIEEETEQLETPEVPETPEAPPPAFSPEDIERLNQANAELKEQLAEMRGALDALKSQPPTQIVQAPQPGDPVITDEEIDEAVSEGKGAGTKFRQLVDQAVKRATARLKAEEIDPLRNYGTASLKELASGSIRNLEYYNDYKKEIEQIAASVPAENLGSPQTWQLIYNNVIGAHAKEIAAKEVEAALRKQRDPGDSATPSGQNRQVEQKAPPIKARDLGGTDAENALRYKGVDEDELAKRMGYSSWAEYAGLIDKLEAEERGNA